MKRTPSEVVDELALCFLKGHNGWSYVHTDVKGEIYSFSVTEIYSDPASELVELAEGILSNISTSIILPGEPGGHLLSVTRDAEQPHTMMFELYEIWGSLCSYKLKGDEKNIFSIRVKRKQLFAILITELWRVRQFLMEPSFQKKRGTSFPVQELQELNARWDTDRSLGPSFLK